MNNVDKKESKLKKFLSDHKADIATCCCGVVMYFIGVGVGSIVFGPSKEMSNFFAKSTRGVYLMNKPENATLTAAELFKDAATMADWGVQPSDQIVGAIIGIAKAET